MIKSDFHTHSYHSSDSTAPMETMIKRAIELGLDTICFTDHMDYDFPVTEGLTFVFDPDKYFEELTLLEEKYRGEIKILKGVELGLMPHLTERIHQLISSYPFDFIIGSSHLVRGRDPYFKSYWENCTEKEGIEDYFKSILENINHIKDFNVYGHLDYVIRYAPSRIKNYDYNVYRELFDTILTTLIHGGKGIEVNTAGLKYGLDFPHPHMDILKRYKELGGEILTIGSDGHKPEHLAYDFHKANELLISLGYTYYTVFDKRKPSFIKLD
ncbi:MAG: histidinol-phosphatase HisJ family protein [Anaerocolumna sp.]